MALCLAPPFVSGASIEITAAPALKQVDPGTAAVFTLTLQNTGTATDVVTLEVSTVPKNWTSLFSDDSIQIAAGTSGTTSLTIKPSKDALVGDTNLTVTALSTVTSTKATTNLKVRVKQIYKIDLQVTSPGELSAGKTVTIPVSIRNDGNGPDHVTVSVIPTGATTSWAKLGTATYDLGVGESRIYSYTSNVPKDTETDNYIFMIKARSSGDGVEETKNVEVDVQGGSVMGLSIDPLTLSIIAAIIFFVLVVAAILLIPNRKTALDPEATTPKDLKAPKKVKKKKIAAKTTDDHTKHLDRIEKRIEELHEKVERLHDSHREVMGHFEDHMVKHHKKEVEPLPPPPKPTLPPPLPPSKSKDLDPGPHPEALHPEGPPENMSLGDAHGELGHMTGPEPLKTAPPKKEAKKCSNCGSAVEPDWVKCPTCSGKL
jgi:hypothetical protein